MNDAWRSLNPAHTPVVVLNLFIPPGWFPCAIHSACTHADHFNHTTDAFDVNVSPDKRTIFFHDENSILEGIRVRLDDRLAQERALSLITSALLPVTTG